MKKMIADEVASSRRGTRSRPFARAQVGLRTTAAKRKCLLLGAVFGLVRITLG